MTSADVITMVCFCHPLMGQVFFLLHVLLIQLGLLLIFQWHTWTFTRRHKQMCSDTMWPSYTTESSLHISGTDTALLLSRDFIAVWVYGVYLSAGTRCTSSDWRSTAVHPAVWWRRLGPQWNKPAQQESWRHCSHIYFLQFQPWKNWRRQKCFSASLGWPLDISDTSRCVKCFNVIFVFG